MKPHEPSYLATVAHRLATVLLILWMIFAVYLAVEAIAGSRSDVAFEASATVREDRLPAGVYATSEQRTGVAISDPTPREQRLAFLIDLLPMALWFAVLWLLRAIVRSVRDGDPFVQPNVRRLRAIGLLLAAGSSRPTTPGRHCRISCWSLTAVRLPTSTPPGYGRPTRTFPTSRSCAAWASSSSQRSSRSRTPCAKTSTRRSSGSRDAA